MKHFRPYRSKTPQELCCDAPFGSHTFLPLGDNKEWDSVVFYCKPKQSLVLDGQVIDDETAAKSLKLAAKAIWPDFTDPTEVNEWVSKTIEALKTPTDAP